MNVLRHISDLLGLGVGPVAVLVGVVATFVAATALRGLRLLVRPNAIARERWRSLGTWWVLLALLAVMLVVGRPAVVVVMAVLSLLALREGLRLTGHGGWLPVGALLTAGVYAGAWLGWRTVFTAVLPSAAAVALVAEALWRTRLRPRGAGVRDGVLAFLATVAGPAFVVAAASFPAPATLEGTRMGWLVLLLVLTELNDIAQAWWGRTLGRSRMAPRLSPNKTWAGFWGGVLTTMAAAVVAGPLLTDWGRAAPPGAGGAGVSGAAWVPVWLWPAVLGLLVALSGVAGDLTASRLKRRAGVKDSGRLLPGHGGVLDRLDSLSLAAPVYFILTWALWFRP